MLGVVARGLYISFVFKVLVFYMSRTSRSIKRTDDEWALVPGYFVLSVLRESSRFDIVSSFSLLFI